MESFGNILFFYKVSQSADMCQILADKLVDKTTFTKLVIRISIICRSHSNKLFLWDISLFQELQFYEYNIPH